MQRLVLLALIAVSISFAGSVSAQEEAQVDTPVAEEASTVEDQAALEAQVQAAYRANLEQYRAAYRQYDIAKNQFEQLETLASLEGAVTATRTVMAARGKVLEQYFQLLQLRFQATQTIPDEIRQEKIARIEEVRSVLAQHVATVETTTDRAGINSRAEEFLPIQAQVTAVGYDTLTQIKVAQLRTVYQLSLVFVDEIDQQIRQQYESDQPMLFEKQRGIEQIRSLLTVTETQLAGPEDIIADPDYEPGPSTLDTTKTKLLPVYTSLSQVVNYMAEVLDIRL